MNAALDKFVHPRSDLINEKVIITTRDRGGHVYG